MALELFWSLIVLLLFFFSLLGWFTGDPQEQEAVCKADNRLEQCKNQVSYTASVRLTIYSHTRFINFCVCVFRSQASTGPQARQDGLREEVEEAWRRLESIKVAVFPLASIHPWCTVVEQDTEPGISSLDLWPLCFSVSAGPVLCRSVSLCNKGRRLC